MCFQGDTKKRLVHTLLLVKGSPNFLHTHLWQILPFFPPLILFFKSIISCSFPAAFPVRPVIHHQLLCDPFHRAHHGNLVRPGKNAPQRTQGHILYKRAKASGSFFSSKLPLAGMAKAQAWVCVAETTAFYRLGDKNDWMANASSLTESCMELRSLIAVTHSHWLRSPRSLRHWQ